MGDARAAGAAPTPGPAVPRRLLSERRDGGDDRFLEAGVAMKPGTPAGNRPALVPQW